MCKVQKTPEKYVGCRRSTQDCRKRCTKVNWSHIDIRLC